MLMTIIIMLRSIGEDIKRVFAQGNVLKQIIIINCAIWVLFNILKIIFIIPGGMGVQPIFSDIVHFFCFKQEMLHNLTHPWVFVTAGFMHIDFGHILWNMLGLYWFGNIVGDLLGNKRIVPLYLLGTLMGLLAFYMMHFLPIYAKSPAYAMGASAAMMAMTAAAATAAPDYLFHLLLVGPVRLKYIALLTIFLNIIAIADNYNTGGAFAHLGGAFWGWLYVQQLQNGRDLGSFLDTWKHFFAKILKSRASFEPKVTYRREKEPPKPERKTEVLTEEQRLNEILEKIKQQGYDKLSPEEKNFLFKASGK